MREMFVRARFAGRLQRVDRPLIPPDAVREIRVNAPIHLNERIARHRT